jgi:hypothetical protein
LLNGSLPKAFGAAQVFPAGGRQLQDPRQAPLTIAPMQPRAWVFRLDLIVQAGRHGPPRSPTQAIVRPRTICLLLASLAVTLVASGCGGASPETRAEDTRIALYGTSTPPPLEAARTVVAMGTVTRLDPEIVATLRAEATLTIATPAPMNVATHMAQTQNPYCCP